MTSIISFDDGQFIVVATLFRCVLGDAVRFREVDTAALDGCKALFPQLRRGNEAAG